MTEAKPRDFGGLAPLVVEHAGSGDPVGVELMSEAAAHVDALAARLLALGARSIALSGGLGGMMAPHLSPETRRHLVPAQGDALDGAVALARGHAAGDHPATPVR
jgi:glucosamine kinase